MEAFLAAVLGALVGGAASGVGGYLLERHRRVTEVRVELYREILPPVIASASKVLRVVRDNRQYPGDVTSRGGNGLGDRVELLLRAAMTGNRHDRAHARRIREALDAMGAFHDEEAFPYSTTDPGYGDVKYPAELQVDRFQPLAEQLQNRLVAYEEYLKDQFE